METTLLLIFVTVEAALLAFRLITNSRQERVASIVRIVTFLAFCLLVATSVIEWSVRWYGLGALLFLLAAWGAWHLLRRGEGAEKFRARRVVLRAALLTLLFFVAMIPALVFPSYQPLSTTGHYSVAEDRATYSDESRTETYAGTGEARQVNVTFWYPADGDGRYPLVIFSHGSFGIETSNESLFRELASHGYVVASLGHPYHSFWTKDAGGRVTWLNMDYAREIQQEDAKTDKQNSLTLYRKWMGIRMGDIDFALNSILGEAAAGADGVYRLIDPGQIGVMGHSLGGSAALGIGRQRDDVGAVLALESPLMADIEGIESGEFVFNDDPYPVPVLNIYSNASWSHLSEWPQYGGNYGLLTDPGPEASSLHISDTGHLGLTDLSLSSPFLTRILDGSNPTTDSVGSLRLINETSLAFFDAYLKGSGEFAP